VSADKNYRLGLILLLAAAFAVLAPSFSVWIIRSEPLAIAAQSNRIAHFRFRFPEPRTRTTGVTECLSTSINGPIFLFSQSSQP
jgi:hypothetical protein